MFVWIFLLLAIAFEVSGTTGMKLSEGFSRPLWRAGMLIFYLVSFGLNLGGGVHESMPV
jgi:small multidrug resistance pump